MLILTANEGLLQKGQFGNKLFPQKGQNTIDFQRCHKPFTNTNIQNR